MSTARKPAPWDIVGAEFVAGAQKLAQLPAPITVELAFAGRSNVGKSSLMNALMGRRRLVRTSSTPGCTRQINAFEAKARDGAQFHLIDLPGYGYAKRSKVERSAWAELIEAYLLRREALRAVAVLVDARRGVEAEEEELVSFVRSRQGPPAEVVVVATKIDKIGKSKRKAALGKLRAPAGTAVLGVSAETGEGLDRLWRELRKTTSTPVEATI
ncbi:MAG: ribosome biogenesis GTP-binding protein YihA/YsxC [Myxococcota bacterium]